MKKENLRISAHADGLKSGVSTGSDLGIWGAIDLGGTCAVAISGEAGRDSIRLRLILNGDFPFTVEGNVITMTSEPAIHRDGCTGALTDQHGNYVEEA